MTCHYRDSAFDMDDGEACSIVGPEREVKTKKVHQCCECRQPIPAGERCHSISYLQEGKWRRDYRCLECAFIVEFVETSIKACVPWGLLQEAADTWDIDISQFRRPNEPNRPADPPGGGDGTATQ